MTTKFNFPHLDAAENYFFQRELEQILTEQFDIKHVELMARKLVPIANNIDPGAESVTYRQFDSFGKAKRISNEADDLPMVNVAGNEYTSKIKAYGAAFGYSVQELKAAAKAGRPLERDRADAARKAIDLKLDDLAADGDTDAGTYGLLSVPNADTFTVPDGAAALKTWASKTPDEILADLNGLVSQVKSNTKGVEKVRRILIPLSQYSLIQTRARSSTSDTTILNFFLSNNPGVEVMEWERLLEAGATGTDRMVGYDPNPMNIRLVCPVEFEMEPPEKENYMYKINCSMRCGGVIAPYPKSIIYGDGI